tara:strand:+ start:988 stop:1554 length:567 start_codon:yes stop_codon:yes gene_type:complete
MEPVILPLVIWPDVGLTEVVAQFAEDDLGSDMVRNIAASMLASMYHYRGVGLASTQVGVPFAIFTTDFTWQGQNDNPKTPRVFLNPVISGASAEAQQLGGKGEGCLSFPYQFNSPVTRHQSISLDYYDFDGEKHTETFSDYEAIVIQHEFDHLRGACFIDRLSPLKKDMAIRKARKVRKSAMRELKAQ